jgi:2-polyprenyl-3-methyl-5-hydroxy-6-metoxy-1,4-benzoquinol methylase
MSCPLCRSNRRQLFSNLNDLEYHCDGSFNFTKCTHCSLIWIDPTPSQKELNSFYPSHYHGFNTQSNFIIKSLYIIVNYLRIKKYLLFLQHPSSSLLDVGCADANYFDSLKKVAPHVHCTGIENNEVIVKQALKCGRDVRLGTIDDLDQALSFDLIIMNNLIEHVRDPVQELRKARSLLKKGGVIFVETPNTDSWDFKFCGKYWGGLHTPRHTFLFNPKSTHSLCNLTNLKVEKFMFPVNTDHWALSFQNLLQSTRLFNSNLQNGRVWYFKYFLFLFIPINFIQKILGKTGSMEIILTKSSEND